MKVGGHFLFGSKDPLRAHGGKQTETCHRSLSELATIFFFCGLVGDNEERKVFRFVTRVFLKR
jgi:hypothetical protein